MGGAREAPHPREAELVGGRRLPALARGGACGRHADLLVLLGAVAAQGLLGKQFRVTKQRGELVDSPLAPHVTATIHPSAILRGELESQDLIEDLVKAVREVDGVRNVENLLHTPEKKASAKKS